MVETRACEFCGEAIEPGTGLLLVTNDGGRHHYCSSKCESNADLGRSSRDVEWAGREPADEAAEVEDEDAEPAEPASPEEPATPTEPEPEAADDEEAADADETPTADEEEDAEATEDAEDAADEADEESVDEAAEGPDEDEASEDEAGDEPDEGDEEPADDAGEEPEESTADEDDAAADAGDIPDDLEGLDYRELQEIAKEHDVAANQSTEDLVEQLGAIRDGDD